MPMVDTLLTTPSTQSARKALGEAKVKQAKYYNRGAKDRQLIPVGQSVRVKFDDKSDWRKEAVVKHLPYRSYEVEMDDGTVRRRTSRHVRFSSEPPLVYDHDDLEHRQPAAGMSQPPSHPIPAPQPVRAATPPPPPPPHTPATQDVVRTRSGRVVVKPSRFR